MSEPFEYDDMHWCLSRAGFGLGVAMGMNIAPGVGYSLVAVFAILAAASYLRHEANRP